MATLDDRLQDAKRQYDLALSCCDKEQQELHKAEQHLQACLAAQDIVQRVAQTVQQEAHRRIAGVVSRCLQSVFGDDCYEFTVEFDRRRGRTEASLYFVRDGVKVDPLTASGGGVVDVAAFALRLSCLMLARPQVRRVLVLDEPFRFVSVDYRDQVRQLLETLSREMDVQIIMVTHSDELCCGKVVQL